ncbi:hypothetical protein [Vannielia litorea]|uniref:hypothetical protein n=1 Tax=Vannielia litorea TaxID=1217970 RepID=UPI001BD0EE76|nr:hypothetical protein [Vannielia litorea]MBS8228916.1 hypothetical protein [Vannielia litorea]
MTELSPSHTALRLCIALAFAGSVLALFLASIPPSMIELRPPLYQPQGLAYGFYIGASLIASVLTMLTAALLPQATVLPASSRIARIVAFAATGAVALIALATFGLATLLEGANTDPTRAYWTQVIVQSLGALITVLPALVLTAALALRLPPGLARGLALVALALLIPMDIAANAGLSPVPTAGLLLALLLATAYALHRSGGLPAQARLWLIGLAALWTLPWALGHLPAAGTALMIDDPSRRGSALAEALLGDPAAYHLASQPVMLLCLGTLATLLFRHPARNARTMAMLLSLTGLAAALPAALEMPALPPAEGLDMLRSGVYSAGQVLAASTGWLGALLTPPIAALTAAWLWLRGTRTRA